MVIFYNFSRKRKMKKLNLIKIVFHKGDFFTNGKIKIPVLKNKKDT